MHRSSPQITSGAGRRQRAARILAAAFAVAGFATIGAASNGPIAPEAEGKPKAVELGAKKVAGFTEPTSVVPVAGTRAAYVTERDGRVFRLDLASGQKALVADLRPVVTNGNIEQGLLSSAPAPDFASSRLLYLYFTRQSDKRQEVARLRLDDAGTGTTGPRETVLIIPDARPGHNGGQLLFGPEDLLYIGVGDGGNVRMGRRIVEDPDRHAQDLGDLRGKILRIRPLPEGGYAVPADNPFSGPGDERADEILAWGLRNPWRFSFDSVTERFFIGDVGAQSFEEVNSVSARRLRTANFGWSALEGRSIFHKGQMKLLGRGKRVKPVLVYGHASGWCSVTGGAVVRGSKLPLLRGRYVYANYCQGRIYSFRPTPNGGALKPRRHGISLPGLNSFGVGEQGDVWVTTLFRGAQSNAVYRLVQR